MPILLGLLALAAVAAFAMSKGGGGSNDGAAQQLPPDLAQLVAAAKKGSLDYEGFMNLQQKIRERGYPAAANDLVAYAQLLPGAPPVPAASLMMAALQTNNPAEMNRVAQVLETGGFAALGAQLRAAAAAAPQVAA